MKHLGTIARGIRTPIIKAGDNLEDIVFNSLVNAQKEINETFNDNDVIAITEAVVSIAANNYITVDELANILKEKFKTNHIGVLFPILSRNRFSLILKALARAFNHITMMLSYPADEVGNHILDEEVLLQTNFNPYIDVLSRKDYEQYFSSFKHPFTGINMVKFYEELVEKEGSKLEIIFGNNPKDILNYSQDILVASIHRRKRDVKILKDLNANQVYDLTEIANEKSVSHGYNQDYGMLGSNQATDESLKLFPNKPQAFVDNLQKRIKDYSHKNVEVMIYGDGAFKDPIGQIWELADPVVSPAYTRGLEGSPNEIKLKYLSDNKFKHLKGEELNLAIKKAIEEKNNTDETSNLKLGTTPRRYQDLLGSLADLMSGSGDKGTPVIWISNYFTNYSK